MNIQMTLTSNIEALPVDVYYQPGVSSTPEDMDEIDLTQDLLRVCPYVKTIQGFASTGGFAGGGSGAMTLENFKSQGLVDKDGIFSIRKPLYSSSRLQELKASNGIVRDPHGKKSYMFSGHILGNGHDVLREINQYVDEAAPRS